MWGFFTLHIIVQTKNYKLCLKITFVKNYRIKLHTFMNKSTKDPLLKILSSFKTIILKTNISFLPLGNVRNSILDESLSWFLLLFSSNWGARRLRALIVTRYVVFGDSPENNKIHQNLKIINSDYWIFWVLIDIKIKTFWTQCKKLF